MHVCIVMVMNQAAQEEVINRHLAMGLHASAEAVATNCSSPASSSSPSRLSVELLADDLYPPNLEITLGRQDWTTGAWWSARNNLA
jgi:hypothetical protein